MTQNERVLMASSRNGGNRFTDRAEIVFSPSSFLRETD